MPDLKIDVKLDDAEAKRELSGLDKAMQGLGGGVGKALGAVGRATAVALGAASAALGALGAQAISAYADWEQLAGGVETLFGDSAATVMADAAAAFQTAGMSANEYMATATSSAAALVSSLGGDTEEAARLANLAVVSMADNANKMGTSMESIQNAYAGFAKGNYSMLDNLKLGYGGTREEMERLLADAEAISGVHYDISSYADVVQAIDVIQQEMGIAGTTAEEAAGTISGSMAMMGAAWQNLVAGLANPDADLGQLMDDFAASVETVLDNLGPAISNVADGIARALPEILPRLVEMGVGLVGSILEGILSSVGSLVDGMVQVVTDVAAMLPSLVPQLVDAAVTLFMALVEALPEIMPALIDAASVAITAVVSMLPTLVPQLLAAAVNLFKAIVDGILRNGPTILSTVASVVRQAISALAGFVGSMLSAAGQLFGSIVTAIRTKAGEIAGGVRSALSGALSAVTGFVGQFVSAGGNIISGIVRGIRNAASSIVSALRGVLQGALDSALSFLGINSPSRLFRDEVGRWIPLGAAEGVEAEADQFAEAVTRSLSLDGISVSVPDLSPDVTSNGADYSVVGWLESKLGPTIARYAPEGGDTYNLPPDVYADSQTAAALQLLGRCIDTSVRMGAQRR